MTFSANQQPPTKHSRRSSFDDKVRMSEKAQNFHSVEVRDCVIGIRAFELRVRVFTKVQNDVSYISLSQR